MRWAGVLGLRYACDDESDYHYEIPVDTSSGGSVGDSILVGVQERLKVKLESRKGPMEVVVIDHVERPSEN